MDEVEGGPTFASLHIRGALGRSGGAAMTAEVFADGIGGIRIVGDTARIDFVSLTGDGRFESRVRVVAPVSNLNSMIDILTKAQRNRLAAADDGTEIPE
ncbi:hypothetical protein [Brevundimonas sp.]|uniref:hypothetical protein n=1 Tax=Brevundimonas sp. TaxID=1871086 RepID=UPI0025C21DC5|nr:hypothetical protein [Brevundimonas sp.]